MSIAREEWGGPVEVKQGSRMGDWSVLDTEAPHIGRIAAESDFWENHGWCLRFSDGETEYLLWTAFYIIRSGKGRGFVVDDVRVNQAVTVTSRLTSDDEMGDARDIGEHEFNVVGTHWSEYRAPDQLEVSYEDNGVVWTMDGRSHYNYPSDWTIRGRAGPLELDLVLTPVADPFTFEGFEKIHGSESLARLVGKIRERDKWRRVEGFGQHEKVHTTYPIRTSKKGGWASLPPEQRHVWQCGLGQQLGSSFLLNQPGERADYANAHVLIGKEVYVVPRSALRIEEVSHWEDPLSGVNVPVAWEITAEVEQGIFRLAVQSQGRAFYLWDYLRGQTSLLYWFLARARASWQPREGTVVIEDIPYAAHTNRPFLYWGDQ